MIEANRIICGDALTVLEDLPSSSIHMSICSPPYFHLRSYNIDGQLGLEPTYTEYVTKLCNVFDEVKRVLRPDGTLWVNLGDSYSGDGCTQKRPRMLNKKMLRAGSVNPGVPHGDIPRKSLCLIPFRFAIEMIRRGWIVRNVLIWRKPNAIPESVKDRFTVDFEYLFLLSKSRFYYFEQQFEPARYVKGMRNVRSVWNIPTTPLTANHFAAYPEKLVEMPIEAGCPEGGIVLDVFLGSGTTALVAERLGRRWLGIELNPSYVALAEQRLAKARALIRPGKRAAISAKQANANI